MKRISSAAALAATGALASASLFAQSTSTPSTMETVEVIGTRSSIETEAAQIELIPGGASLIDLEDFADRNVGHLADVLRYVPGVWAVSDAGTDDIFFSSRGSNLDATDWDMNGIKLMQDGLPVTAADGNNHNRVIDPLTARHATVARGANAMRYGASTLGGAIDFATQTAHDAPKMELRLDGGHHGRESARLSVGRMLSPDRDGLVTLEAKRWDGHREHNAQRRAGVYANAGWQASANFATRFYATYLENDQELPGTLSRSELESNPGSASRAAIDGHYQIDVTTLRLANKTGWQIDAARRLEAGLSIERQDLFHPIVWVAADLDGPGPEPEVELFSLLVDTQQRDVGAMARYSQVVGDHDLTIGFNYGRNEVEGGNYRNLRGRPNGLRERIDNQAATLEAFALDRWALGERTTLILGAQAVSAHREVRTIDAATSAVDHPHDRYAGINPRIGFVRSIGGDTSVYANASRLFEPPTHYQLEDHVLGGDATLDPMRGTVIEIGTRGDAKLGAMGRWSWDVSIYRAEIEDEILAVEDPLAPGESLTTNVPRTVHAGVEAALGASLPLPRGGWTFEPQLALTINDFRFDDDPLYGDNALPAAPEHFARGELGFRTSGSFFVAPTFDVIGKRWADFANTYEIGSHTLLGLRAGWDGGPWRAFVELRNLRDERHVASHSVRNVAAPDEAILSPGEPRSAYFGVVMRWR